MIQIINIQHTWCIFRPFTSIQNDRNADRVEGLAWAWDAPRREKVQVPRVLARLWLSSQQIKNLRQEIFVRKKTARTEKPCVPEL